LNGIILLETNLRKLTINYISLGANVINQQYVIKHVFS